MEENCNLITPHRYGFQLGRDTLRDVDGKYIVIFDGREIYVENNDVSFDSNKELSFAEFQERVKGTIGIRTISGKFRDDTFNKLYNFSEWLIGKYVINEYEEWTNGIDTITTKELVEKYIETYKNVIN